MNIPTELQDAILKNKLVVFVGSGTSTKFKLPTWKKLVSEIINETSNEDYKKFIPLLDSGLLKPYEVLEKLTGEKRIINSYIKKNFNIDINQDFSLHRKILTLSGQIVTTNYDNAFERADPTILPTVYTSDFNVSEISKSGDPYIFKLHGCLTEPDKCVVFQAQYDNIYKGSTAAKHKLMTLFADKIILFIGFGFQDKEINALFSDIDEAFSGNNRHFILTKEAQLIEKIPFLSEINLGSYEAIDTYIDLLLDFKSNNTLKEVSVRKYYVEPAPPLRIAYLTISPLDLSLEDQFEKVYDCFKDLDAEIFSGSLNFPSLEMIENFDLLVIVTKVFKQQCYYEDEYLKSELADINTLLAQIPNENIPILLISDVNIDRQFNSPNPFVSISTLKSAVIKRFIYKFLLNGNLNFHDDAIKINQNTTLKSLFVKGKSIIHSLYGINKDLDIGKKCMSDVIGRVDEQHQIAKRLLATKKSNKLFNLKSAGGNGKTTLIKKVAYELYLRGHFREGVSFKSCENAKTFADFEELMIQCFKMDNIEDFRSHMVEHYSNRKIDCLIILDNFETVSSILTVSELEKVIDLITFATDYATICITSRERLSLSTDVEDIYTLPLLNTDDAYSIFIKYYGTIKATEQIKILRTDILEDLLNNNPLAIKLVTNSRLRFNHISELREQLRKNLFGVVDEEYSEVFSKSADLNIERSKSIYASISYSYNSLSEKEKFAFELLSLFPDGISLSNLKNVS